MDNIYADHANKLRREEAAKAAVSKAATLQEKIAKLPKWASEHIETIIRQREEAVKRLNDFTDTQTPSAFSVEEYVSTGEQGKRQFKKKYIQTDDIRIEANGICMEVRVGLEPREGIFVSYGSGARFSGGDAALIPTSNQQFKIITKGSMRD